MIPIVGSITMMLFYTKIEKFGMLSIMSVLVAIIMFVIGMGYLGAPLIIASGVIADLIAKSGGYKSFKKTVISYGAFFLWICANYFPVVVSADSYRKNLIDGAVYACDDNSVVCGENYKDRRICLRYAENAYPRRHHDLPCGSHALFPHDQGGIRSDP